MTRQEFPAHKRMPDISRVVVVVVVAVVAAVSFV